MRITNDLPQFSAYPVLLLVSSSHDTHVYFAHQGVIQRISSLHVTKPAYSDKEGFFAERSRTGGVIRSGNVLRDTKKDVMVEFKRVAHEHIIPVLDQYQGSSVYLFTVPEREALFKKIFSQLAPRQVHVRAIFHGNFIHTHPFELLAKIQTWQQPRWRHIVETKAHRLLPKFS